MGANKKNSIQNGKALCINQLFAAPPHFVGMYIYFARMFDFCFFLSMSFACMLGPWTPRKASFRKNLLLYHFPAFFSIVFKEQPIVFVRKLAQWYVRPVFLQCWQKVFTRISHGFGLFSGYPWPNLSGHPRILSPSGKDLQTWECLW